MCGGGGKQQREGFLCQYADFRLTDIIILLYVCEEVSKGVSEILCLIDNLQSHLTDNNRLSQILFIFLQFPAEELTLMLHAQKQRTVEHEVGNSSSRLEPVLFCEG